MAEPQSDVTPELVATYLEATHHVGEHLLRTLDDAAGAMGVPYYLTAGTLLGAHRAGGWIPWDDDVDVVMFRDHYDALRAGVREHLPDDVRFVCGTEDDGCYTVIPRLLHLGSQRVHRGRVRASSPIETQHVPLDIFVLDRAPRGAAARRLWRLALKLLDLVVVARHTSLRDVVTAPGVPLPKRLVEALAVLVAAPLSSQRWHRVRERVATLPGRLPGRGGPWMGTNYATPHALSVSFDRASYEPGAGRIDFEGRSYPAPRDVERVLATLYGPDFMTPPADPPAVPDHLRGGVVVDLDGRHWDARPPAESGETEAESERFTFASNRSRVLRSPLYAVAAAVALAVPRRADLWVFGRRNGVGEGPLAVLQAARELVPGARLVWIAQDADQLAAAEALGIESHLVTSRQAAWLTLRAGVVVLAYGLGDVVRACAPGAHIVQTWHGAPLKKICLDSPVSMDRSAVYAFLFKLANKLTRTLPAGSEEVGDRFQSAFRWPDRSRIAVVGDPRCDPLATDDPEGARAEARARMAALWGTSELPRHLVLYAPTWRDGEEGPGFGVDDLTPAVRAALEDADAWFVIREHPWGVVAGAATSERVRFASPELISDISSVMHAFDLLVSDYSAIAIDFSRLLRPQLYYAPDLADYVAARGLYEPYETFTGGYHFDHWDDVLTTARDALLDDDARARVVVATSAQLRRRYHAHADGRAAHRLVQHVRARTS